MHSRAAHPQCPECRSDTDYVFLATPAPERRLRLRSSAEITKRVTGDIRKLNTRLLDISNRLAIALQKHEVARTPQGRILVALFKKAVNTFRGIQTLMSKQADRGIVRSPPRALRDARQHDLFHEERIDGGDPSLVGCSNA